LKMHYREWGIVSLAVPPLGCGQGKLDWSIIGPTLYRHLSELEIPVEVYAPFGTSPDQLEESYLSRGADSSSRSSAAIDAPSIAIVDILARIESERHSRPIGRTSFQKLAYFATEAGIPTELDFVKGSYGPFSEQLKPLLTKLVNNGLIEEEKLGNMFAVKVGPTFEDSSKKHTTDLHKWSELENKVVDLFLRLSTRTAEVAATVAFVAKQLHVGDSKPSEMDVLDGVLDWKQRRKPPLEKYEVASAIRNLAALDWIDVTASSDLPVEDEFSAEEDVALV
ncbi:MAG: hypothetical protein K8F91_10940, partial [Candidatus Obscuribacterales bacterium]|nr:hypothetical protein [Candidatus Obscuribacterales bacterium]